MKINNPNKIYQEKHKDKLHFERIMDICGLKPVKLKSTKPKLYNRLYKYFLNED